MKRPRGGGFYIQMAGIQQVSVDRLFERRDGPAAIPGVPRLNVRQDRIQSFQVSMNVANDGSQRRLRDENLH